MVNKIDVCYCPSHNSSGTCDMVSVKCIDCDWCRMKCVISKCMRMLEKEHSTDVDSLIKYIFRELKVEVHKDGYLMSCDYMDGELKLIGKCQTPNEEYICS